MDDRLGVGRPEHRVAQQFQGAEQPDVLGGDEPGPQVGVGASEPGGDRPGEGVVEVDPQALLDGGAGRMPA